MAASAISPALRERLSTLQEQPGTAVASEDVVAIVELADAPGVRLITNVVGVAPEDMRVGLEVEVFFEDWTDASGREDSRVWIPLFRPVT